MAVLGCFFLYVALMLQLQSARCNEYTKNDVVVAFPTFKANMAIVQASRTWREGVRTHVTVDPYENLGILNVEGVPFNETFSSTPDFPGFSPAIRHVLAASFAHNQYRGQYKWMLLGDDDTLWSIPGVLNLVQNMTVNADEPYMITDYIFAQLPEKGFTQFMEDTRCQPCDGGRKFCPCVLEPACRFNSSRHSERHDFAAPMRCVMWFQGGSGLVISHGMMEVLTGNKGLLYDVVFSEASTYGDVLLSEAARVVGYGFTAPRWPMRLFDRMQLTPGDDPHTYIRNLRDAMRSDPNSVVAIHVMSHREKVQFMDVYVKAALALQGADA